MQISRDVIASIRLAHVFFNAVAVILFLVQAMTGIGNRKRRLAGGDVLQGRVRLHRRMGPVLVLMTVAGFCGGLILVCIDRNNIIEYPVHLFFGTMLTVFTATAMATGYNISGMDDSLRDIHFSVGRTIVAICVVQVMLGAIVLSGIV